MATFASYFGLRSTLVYTTAGTPVPAGSIYAVSSNVGPVWTNTLTVSSLTGSTIATNAISLQSTTISLGQSTNQTYRNFTNGAYTNTLWGSTLGTSNVLSTVNDVIVSQSGQYQYALQGSQSSIATNQVSRSIDSGVTWQTLNNSGLPVTTYAYQSTISGFPSYTNMTMSATGQYALTSVRGGQLYMSNNANSDTPVFTPANVGGYPYIYMPLENSVADRMGNSVVTATGSVAFNVPGKVGTNAMNLVNTAGSTANNYVRATWTGSSNFTISFWFNAQTVGTQQTILGAYNGGFNFYVTAANVISCGITNLTTLTGPTITVNTWYYVVLVMQTSGVCSMYVNNRLSSSATPTLGGWGALTTSVIQIGSQDVSSAQAFNGYIDDFEIYHFAAPNVVNPLIYLPMEGVITDVMNGTTLTTTGSPGYVPGVVGSQALNLANPAGGTAVNYVRGTWSLSSSFTISFWINQQSSSSSSPQMVFGSSGGKVAILFNQSNQMYANFLNGGGTTYTAITTSFAFSLNTWYHIYYLFQTGGTCALYVNGVLIGSFTNTGGIGTSTTSAFGLGTWEVTDTSIAFNGYIDDFRLYNAAIPYSPINPMNWSQTAVSPTGQYMLAAASNGGVFQSSNFGASWSQLTNSQITSLVSPGQAAKTINGPTVTPNLTGLPFSGKLALTAPPWTQNGITWVASTSSIVNIDTFSISNLFNNNPTSGNFWANSSQTYSTSGNSSGVNTVIQGVGTATGDWAQIQSSVPLVMASYQFATGGSVAQIQKTYYIVGSNDGITWYPIQFGSGGATVTTTAAGTIVPGIIIVNSASTQTFGSSTITTTTYSTTTNAYTYFRLIGLTNYFASASYFELGEWYINFTLPMPLYVAPSSTIVAPQLTGLSTSGTALTVSWTAGSVNWVASASSVLNSSTPLSNVFNNTSNTSWAPSSSTYGSSGNTSGQNTMIQGTIGSIQGEWVQIQSSIPLVLSSYQFATGGTVAQLPKTYYIVGSTDGTTWFPIQLGAGAAVTTTAASTTVPGIITVYSTGAPLAQTFGSSTITTTAYSTAANAYTYFRLIGTSVYAASGAVIEIGEWYIAFSAPAPSNTSLLTVTPQRTGLAAANWTTANGVSWVASSSSIYSSGYEAYLAFNNVTATSTGWTSPGFLYNTGTGDYTGSVTTTILGLGARTGEWLQIQSSVPIVLQSHTFSVGDTVNRFPRIFHIVGSMDGSNWYPIQYASIATNPFTAINSTATNYLTVNTTGTQTLTAGASAVVTTTSYSTSTASYIYFRIISNAIFGSNDGLTQIGEWYINFTAATPNPVNALAISNTNMMVSATGTTAPQLSGLAANTWTVNGVNWTVSASTFLNSSFAPYLIFNNTYDTNSRWVPLSNTYSNTGNSSGVSNTIIGIAGTQTGDWLQIQSSVPLVMSSYQFASGDLNTRLPKTYYITGSNDGSNWYPLQYASAGAVTTTAVRTIVPGVILINSTSTQTFGTSTVATTAYPTSTNAYTYFRLVCLTTYGSNDVLDIGEWFLNFQAGANYVSTNNGITWSTALTAPSNASVLATSGSYVLTGTNQTAYLYSNGITGAYTTPTLTGINANILSAAMSVTGQHMVIVTQGTTNNVFYSTNYGVTWTALTVGNSAMTSCAMSADGSYLTVSNATAVFTLNRNTQGFSITVGNQAGLINQALNTLAIGNQAGQTNQSANSIVLNASTAAVNAYSQGFYVAPIASSGGSGMSSLRVLGYGEDNQIVQSSSFFIGANGNVGIGTANPGSLLNVYGMMPRLQIIDVTSNRQPSIEFLRGQTSFDGNPSFSNWRIVASGGQPDGAMPALAGGMLGFYHNGGGLAGHRLVLSDLGNVGIGITNPGYALHVVGGIYASGDIAALSDQRYKQNIVRLDRSLENLLQLSGYSYTREDYRPGEKQIGLLAQEVATVFPEAVQYDEANDKYGVNYNCLIAPLIESIKSLHEQIEAQRCIIAKLVDRLGPL